MSVDRVKNRKDKGVIKNWFEKNKKSTASCELSLSGNYYNYYGMVKNAPAPVCLFDILFSTLGDLVNIVRKVYDCKWERN